MTPLATAGKQALLAQLESMQIEPEGAARSFVQRLAQENGWSLSYSRRVFDEYARFLFLAATSGHAVTPSDEVDQAWHLHLAYTKHYWEELCGRILGRPLHHGPTAGGAAEATRYRSQYAATLESYRSAFGSEPPGDIWPSVRERFAARYQRVDRRRNWVIPKVKWQLPVAAFFAVGCGMASEEGGASNTFTIVIVSVVLLIAFAAIYLSERRHHNRGGCGGTSCGAGGGSSSRGNDGCGGADAGDGGGDGGGCGGEGCGGCGG